tara:strand:+ start:869 stop:1147 length:279 start_codon:yes stop_codon:yes gene_type:complete
MLAYDCCKQKKPVNASQSIVPQAQSFEFASLPSSIVQTATFEQVFVVVVDTQNRPVDVVQAVVPQVQSLSFTDKPLLLEHGRGSIAQRFSEV